VAGVLLYPIALRVTTRATTRSRGSGQGRGRPGAKAWFAGAVVGILLLSAGNGSVTFAETSLPSGLAAVLVATVPLWMIAFAWPMQRQRVTWRSAAGLAAGLAGVAILVGGGTASGSISGVIIVLGAAASWGFGSVLSHRLPLPGHALLAAAMEMIVGGVVLLAVAGGTGEFSHVHWSSVPATSWIALAYLIGPGSILAFTAYGYALSHLPVTTVSTYAYVNPVVAVLAGILLLGEHLTWREGLGAGLVIGSVVIILHRSRSTARPTTTVRSATRGRGWGRERGRRRGRARWDDSRQTALRPGEPGQFVVTGERGGTQGSRPGAAFVQDRPTGRTRRVHVDAAIPGTAVAAGVGRCPGSHAAKDQEQNQADNPHDPLLAGVERFPEAVGLAAFHAHRAYGA
jgi:drug/metabolite transporter (DMT)-like permease